VFLKFCKQSGSYCTLKTVSSPFDITVWSVWLNLAFSVLAISQIHNFSCYNLWGHHQLQEYFFSNVFYYCFIPTTCFGPYGPSSGGIYTGQFLGAIYATTEQWVWNSSKTKQNKQTPWSESASKLYRSSDRRFSAKWLPTFADKGRHVVSVTDPYGRILGFLDRNRYFFIK
jgi:hypothetical protein